MVFPLFFDAPCQASDATIGLWAPARFGVKWRHGHGHGAEAASSHDRHSDR